MGLAASKSKVAPAAGAAGGLDDEGATKPSIAAPPPAARPPSASAASAASAASDSFADDAPPSHRASSAGVARFFGRRSSAAAAPPPPPAASLDGGDGRVARRVVEEIGGRDKLRRAREENEAQDYNQTGQTEYEMRAAERYSSVPNRVWSPSVVEARAEENGQRDVRERRRSERRDSKAARKMEKDVKKGKVVLPVVHQKGTVGCALQDSRRLGVLNLAKMRLGSVPDAVFEELDGTARVINISGNDLQSIDPRFTEFVLVQRLVAASNLIATVPSCISRMTALRRLDLANNKLLTVPDSFANMPHLEDVDLSGNGLSTLPDSFATLNLVSLRLAGNNFSTPPRVIEAMRSLQELFLDENRLVAVPASWGALTQLVSLSLDVNSIADFPDEILANCTALVNVSVRGNPLTAARLAEKPSWERFNTSRMHFHRYRVEAGAVTLDELRLTDT